MFLLGYDIGISTVKASLLDALSQKLIASASSAHRPAAAHPPQHTACDLRLCWQTIITATQQLLANPAVSPESIAAIGITYDIQGLVPVDKNYQPLDPAVINHRNQTGIPKNVYKILLPGDYITFCFTGRLQTTHTDLSDAVADCPENKSLRDILRSPDLDPSILPQAAGCFSNHGCLTPQAARQLGLKPAATLTYRAAARPNRAFALGVLEPGTLVLTTTPQTVIYAVSTTPPCDKTSPLKTILHVNHTTDHPRYGLFLTACAAALAADWTIRNILDQTVDYPLLGMIASHAPIGSDGLVFLPCGSTLEPPPQDSSIGASLLNLNLRLHNRSHILRAVQEGIAFAVSSSLDTFRTLPVPPTAIRAANTDIFLCSPFTQTLTAISGMTLELYNTDPSQSTARGAGIGAGFYKDFAQTFAGLEKTRTITPDPADRDKSLLAYHRWLK